MPNEIYHSGMTPINKLAVRVVSKGTEYSPALKPGTEVEQKTPFPIRELREVPRDLRHLVGYRFGRLTVMGFSYIRARWSVRCSCGMYCIRTTQAIRNPRNINDACRTCGAMLQRLRRDHFARTGKDIDIESLPMASTARPPLPPLVKGGPRYVAHNSARSCDPPPRKPDPPHWTVLERQIPSSMASAFAAAVAGKQRKSPER